MPWTVKDVDSHKKGLTPRQKRIWVRVANEALARCLKEGRSQSACEGSAVRQANAVAGRIHSQQVLQELTVNISGATVRYEVLDGREYAVATVVPIREGVLNQYYVPASEIAAFVQSWDGLAIPVNHPTDSYGDHVSVNSPAQIEQSIGRFFHAYWDGDRLTGEVWLDTEKCQRLGGEALDILQRIETGEPMECSTAFWAETDHTPGTWNGIAYLGTHRHLRPDHLAILPQGIGACSLDGGCGIRALAEDCPCTGPCTCHEGDDMETEELKPGKLRQALRTLFAFANGSDEEPDSAQKEVLDGSEEEGQEQEADAQTKTLSTHLTHADIYQALCAALMAEQPEQMYAYEHIVDVEDGQFVYMHQGQLMRRGYAVGDNEQITLTGAPQAVQRVTRYVLVGHPDAVLETEVAKEKGDYSMKTKPELIQALIAHEHTAWKPEQQPVLETLEERVLEQMLTEANQRGEEAPLNLQTLKKFLKEELDERDTRFDQKLETFAKASEEKAEREHIVGYLVTHHGWQQEVAMSMSLEALRSTHRSLDPVTYAGNGMPRFQPGGPDEDLPADDPDWK